MVLVEIGGITGIIHPYVGILYIRHILIFKIILVGKLAHSTNAHLSFCSTALLNYKGVLAYTYSRKYPYDDYDYD